MLLREGFVSIAFIRIIKIQLCLLLREDSCLFLRNFLDHMWEKNKKETCYQQISNREQGGSLKLTLTDLSVSHKNIIFKGGE